MVPSTITDKVARIAHLNDAFRITFLRGTVCITAAVSEIGPDFVKEALQAVRDFNAFEPADDPYGEHDFGALEIGGRRLFWKIDYFDPSMLHHAPDPADRDATRRVLTVMFAEEY